MTFQSSMKQFLYSSILFFIDFLIYIAIDPNTIIKLIGRNSTDKFSLSFTIPNAVLNCIYKKLIIIDFFYVPQ